MASITVEVDLDDFDDSELIEEMKARGLDTPVTEDREELEAIYHLMRMRKSREAYKRMYNYIRDRLGKAV